jgi:micrococcal nuclease
LFTVLSQKYKTYSIIITACLLLFTGCILDVLENPDPNGLIPVIVTKVIDGDTAYVRFSDGIEEKVRFIGVDAPEINHPTKGLEPFGTEAETFARLTLEKERIWLEFDIGERDQYDRLLAYLWLELPTDFSDAELREYQFNARLLLEGYAEQVIFEPNVKYVDYYYRYEEEARQARRGLWGIK